MSFIIFIPKGNIFKMVSYHSISVHCHCLIVSYKLHIYNERGRSFSQQYKFVSESQQISLTWFVPPRLSSTQHPSLKQSWSSPAPPHSDGSDLSWWPLFFSLFETLVWKFREYTLLSIVAPDSPSFHYAQLLHL